MTGQWMDIVDEANKETIPSDPMTTEDFISVTAFKNDAVVRKKDIAGYKVEWLKMQWIRLSREAPSHVYVKSNLNEETEWSVLDLTRQVRGQPHLTEATPFV